MLTFVGLGLFDKHDVSEKGRACIARADKVFLECYTSRLMGSSIGELEQYYNKKIHLLSREDVEQNPDRILQSAESAHVAFLTAGDPMVSTTHIDLRIRAAERGIGTSIIHGPSISSAVCGLTGLQNYRFGKSCSLPFPHKNWAPTTPIDVVAGNLAQNLHTLVYLDIQDDRHMTIHEAVDLLEDMAATKRLTIPLYVGVARAGSDQPVIGAGPADRIRAFDFGPPLHILIIPAGLHDMEKKYLEVFAGL
ncbi:MAG: diphthine synthase [Methanoregula sp.]|nr:MAG: diphthine synthase [Methanoregula sp.]